MGEKRGEREAFEKTVKRVMDQGKAVGGQPDERKVREFIQKEVAAPAERDRERSRKR